MQNGNGVPAENIDPQPGAEATSPLPEDSEIYESAQVNVNEVHVNGNTENTKLQPENNDIHTLANKKRKLADLANGKVSGQRPISPPWKRIAVEGPTSFVEEGRRKSSRTNFVPIELQPHADKRRTRGATQQGSHLTKSKYGGVFKPSPLTSSASKHTQNNVTQIPPTSGKAARNTNLRSPSKNTQTSTAPSHTSTEFTPPPKRSHKKKIRPISPSSNQTPTDNPYRTRRIYRRKTTTTETEKDKVPTTGRWHNDDKESVDAENGTESAPSSIRRPQRLSLKVRMPTVSMQHPGNVLLERKHESFQEWFNKEGRLGLALDDTEPNLTDLEAVREARLRIRINDATKPGGLLTKGRCQFFRPEASEPPDRQYTHQDRLVAHALYFQKLMDQERRKHKRNAREWAEKAASVVREKEEKTYQEWKQAQPKTEEDIAQEQENAAREVYQQVQEDIKQKWTMVAQLVDAHRMQKWQEEQDRLGKEALNEAIEKSQGLLDRRRMRGDSEMDTDGSDDEGSTRSKESASASSDQSENESNMSSTESESDEDHIIGDDDEGLTQEQLRLKYASVPDIESALPERADKADEEVGNVTTINDKVPSQKTDPAATEMSDASRTEAVQTQDLQRSFSLEQVDDALIDHSNESTDMDDDDEESDSEQSSGQAESDEGESDCDGDSTGLAFLYQKEIKAATEKEDVPSTNPAEMDLDSEEQEDEMEEVSLIPDAIPVATQGPTPTATPGTISEEPLSTTYHEEPPNESEDGSNIKADSRIDKAAEDLTFKTPDQKQASPSADLKTMVEEVSLPTTPVSNNPIRTAVPSLLRGTLREYQHFGLDWLANLYAVGNSGILADEMGLGKTIQTIALLAHLATEHEVWGPHLIVVPTSVMLNWEIEFKKFLPGFKVLTYYGTQQERKQKREGWQKNDKWNVWITSYSVITRDQQVFRRKAWHYMILDEAHNIKNFQSLRWQTLLTFNTRARLLLTGTPLQNNLNELWSLLFFLMPNQERDSDQSGFANLHEFTSWFRKPVEQILEQGKGTMDEEARIAVSKLHKVLRPFLLRRLKADVEKQMPGKYEHVVYCRLSKRQRYLYDGFMSRAQTRETLASGNTFSIMNALMQLRKVCNHPDLFETRQIVTSFAMPKSAIADFEIKELLVRRRLLQHQPSNTVDLNMINLLPGANEPFSALDTIQRQRIGALGTLRHLSSQQWGRINHDLPFDGTSVQSSLACYENGARLSRHGSLSQAAYQTSLRSQRRPLYSQGRMELVQLMFRPRLPPNPPRPTRKHLSEWYSNMSPALSEIVLTLPERSAALDTTISKFACVTPSVVATDMVPLTLCQKGIEVVQSATKVSPPWDPYHEARMRLSIAFPDKRLLQYDCGKLQRLDTLLRTLQAGGHRALIFTQMTRVLDILEQFLNIHGHRYLRLDGSTKLEQRQVLTDRFNTDDRILVFILSSRSGGIGINLTGADTVIFYDLDWNPAMDKQCQDRSHRIGQTRDVHIYRLISEYTIEANILRKANQKRMLDDVVIQEGEFTTDYFNNMGVRDMVDEEAFEESDAEANAAMDRVLGGRGGGRVFEAVEDQEDVVAAREAEQELAQNQDAAEFDEKGGATSASAGTPKPSRPTTPGAPMHLSRRLQGDVERTTTMEAAESGLAAPNSALLHNSEEVNETPSCDDYMMRLLEWELKDIPVQVSTEKNKRPKKGKEQGPRKK